MKFVIVFVLAAMFFPAPAMAGQHRNEMKLPAASVKCFNNYNGSAHKAMKKCAPKYGRTLGARVSIRLP